MRGQSVTGAAQQPRTGIRCEINNSSSRYQVSSVSRRYVHTRSSPNLEPEYSALERRPQAPYSLDPEMDDTLSLTELPFAFVSLGCIAFIGTYELGQPKNG